MVTGRVPTRWRRATLTSRQQEVVDLVAAGLTNREIAARLGLTAGTVGMHVANSLWRLGLKRRAQLAARAIGPPRRPETTAPIVAEVDTRPEEWPT